MFKMWSSVIIATLLLGVFEATAAATVSEPSAVDVARQKTIFLVQHLWKNVSNPHFTTMVRQESTDSNESLIAALQSLSIPLRELEVPSVGASLQYMYSWERIEAQSHGINSLYETYANFLSHQQNTHQPSTRRAWLDLAETVLQDLPLSESIHALILTAADSKDNKTIFQHALQEAKGAMCDNKQSTQLLLYNMYAQLQMTQLKTFVMAQSAWALLQIFEHGDHEIEANQMKSQYISKSKQQANAALQAMKKANRDLWRCDSLLYKEHETYEQLTRLLQGYIENEVDMNPGQTCRGGCQNYQYTERYGCFKNKFCSQQPKCEGQIIDCTFVEADMKVCQSNPGEIRRYEYIEYKKHALFGTERQGNTSDCTLVSVDSWWRFFLPAHCSYCFCLCDEAGPLSDRYFSLDPSTADVTENKVMTGIRFIKVNRVIHMQIQQGTLLPHGAVNSSTLEWVKVNKGKAEYKMSWDRRSIDLDNLEAPEGHAITGVRFREVGSHLNMEIMVTPIIYHKGTLRRPTELSYWIGNENTDSALDNPRTEVKLQSNNVPHSSTGPCQPDSKHDTFVQFTHSDIITDAAQTTVPFLDIQPVVNEPPSLLSGAGLYHKGSKSSAGFLALKISNYDISKHITGDEK